MSRDEHLTITPDIVDTFTRHQIAFSCALAALENQYQQLALAIDNITDIKTFTEHSYQVIVALATLQTSVQDLSRAYINHANTVLAPGRGGSLDANLTNILSESGLLASATAGVRADAVEEGGKKKRKRTPHDPNAPKRALTPYFLYMQSARSQIAKELGDQAKPKEVADEGTRRWTAMPQADKQVSYISAHIRTHLQTCTTDLGQSVPEESCSIPCQDGRLQSWSARSRRR